MAFPTSVFLRVNRSRAETGFPPGAQERIPGMWSPETWGGGGGPTSQAPPQCLPSESPSSSLHLRPAKSFSFLF